MADTEHITVANVSEGPCSTGDPGDPVSLPVVEILTGRGFVTGKSGSGKSNSASVIAENLLDSGFGLFIVDIDGEYYGLKEEYEILHAGGDEECDIQVTTDHAEKLASLALEQNVPIILDISSYLDEDEAEQLLTAVARRLFAKAKKQKQPFLLLVEEVHEFIPENGAVGECGKMLIKIGKRGRKHGLGICGISQRPADVKKDFITQCDWLLWHRLTWDNDTKVVRRILDSTYSDAVESLDDGEGFLATDWSPSVRRVQFHRKRTFDAGATPGLDDVERPDLKSVSKDLVSELQAISEEQSAREDRVGQLREELDRKNSRIAELETELQDARDMSRMADQFVDALVCHVEGAAPGRTERERLQRSPGEMGGGSVTPASGGAASAADADTAEFTAVMGTVDTDDASADPADDTDAQSDDTVDVTADGQPDWFGTDLADAAADTDDAAESDALSPNGQASSPDGEASSPDSEVPSPDGEAPPPDGEAPSTEFSAEEIFETLNSASELSLDDVRDEDQSTRTPREQIESSIRDDAEIIDDAESIDDETEPLVVRELKADIGGLETKTRKMLSFYREFGPSTPLNAHFAAGGDGNRTDAYAHNRTLRTNGLVEHVGRGHYDYRLRDLLAEELDNDPDEGTLDAYASEIEERTDL